MGEDQDSREQRAANYRRLAEEAAEHAAKPHSPGESSIVSRDIPPPARPRQNGALWFYTERGSPLYDRA
jgi:hypothetical protein